MDNISFGTFSNKNRSDIQIGTFGMDAGKESIYSSISEDSKLSRRTFVDYANIQFGTLGKSSSNIDPSKVVFEGSALKIFAKFPIQESSSANPIMQPEQKELQTQEGRKRANKKALDIFTKKKTSSPKEEMVKDRERVKSILFSQTKIDSISECSNGRAITIGDLKRDLSSYPENFPPIDVVKFFDPTTNKENLSSIDNRRLYAAKKLIEKDEKYNQTKRFNGIKIKFHDHEEKAPDYRFNWQVNSYYKFQTKEPTLAPWIKSGSLGHLVALRVLASKPNQKPPYGFSAYPKKR